MKAQKPLFPAYQHGDLARLVILDFGTTPEELGNHPRTRVVGVMVESAIAQRPGWFYVREHHSGEIHLVQGTDLDPITE